MIYQIHDINTRERYTMSAREVLNMANEFEGLDRPGFHTSDISEAIEILHSFNIIATPAKQSKEIKALGRKWGKKLLP